MKRLRESVSFGIPGGLQCLNAARTRPAALFKSLFRQCFVASVTLAVILALLHLRRVFSDHLLILPMVAPPRGGVTSSGVNAPPRRPLSATG